MTIRFIDAQSGTKSTKYRWSKDWPNWSGVVPQIGDTVLLHFGDYNEECVPCQVVQRYIDGTNPNVVTCLIEGLKFRHNYNELDKFIKDKQELSQSALGRPSR